MDDVARSDLILLIGADVYSDNLIFSNKMREAMRANNAKIVLVDPRRTQWEKWANLWLRPCPGTDIAWINGLIRLLIGKGISSKEFVGTKPEGFEAMRSSVERFTPQAVQEATGILPAELEAMAKLYAAAKNRAIVFGPGVTQHVNSTETVKALGNLALLTGETEEAGGGVYPMLTQNNAQGVCDMGGLSEFLPGYERVEDDKARKRFEQMWGREIPGKTGLSYLEIFDRIGEGKIKALYVVGEDPLISLPNVGRLKKCIHQLELLVVQDSFMSHIAEHAHVVLPGVTFAEKDGTFTNMERRVQRVRQAISPVGDSRPDWKILCDLSTRMGYRMEYQNPAHVMDEIASGVPLYARALYSNLDENGIQWASKNGGKRRFFPIEYREPLEKPDDSYPLWIIPGGFHYHYGIGTTSKRAQGLAKVFKESCVEIHPDDAARANLSNGAPVRVISPRGEIETHCTVSGNVPKGVAYLSMSFFPVFANNLLIAARDPTSQNPEYRVFIGRVEKR
jgi:predicted molibdopterin-dependent oxidoreductase YjgC